MERKHYLVLLFVLLFVTACGNQYKHTDNSGQSPAEVNAQLGLAYMQRGDLEMAKAKLDRSLLQDPKLPIAHHYSAELYRMLGMPEKAEEHYARAVMLSPSDTALKNNYAVFLCDQGRHEEAVSQFLELVKSPFYKRQDEAYENAGVCAMRIPDYDRAEKYLRAALQSNPVLPNSLYRMAQISYDRKDYMKARAFLQRLFSVATHNSETLWLGIKIERELGDENAINNYSRLLRKEFPDSEESRLLEVSE